MNGRTADYFDETQLLVQRVVHQIQITRHRQRNSAIYIDIFNKNWKGLKRSAEK
jgi:hypothetical protein